MQRSWVTRLIILSNVYSKQLTQITVFSPVSRSTVTQVISDFVNASGAILAWATGTVVDVCGGWKSIQIYQLKH